MVSLVFNNPNEAKSLEIKLTAESVKHVMAWYAVYFAGDEYTVSLDGRNIPMDHNGEMIE